jgi:hypothetical protein
MKTGAWAGLMAVFAVAGIILSCGSSGTDPVGDSNDFDAIYSIILFDRATAFNLNMLDFSIPDTTTVLGGPYVPVHFWREVDRETSWVNIDFREPVDTVGAVRWANAIFFKRFFGTIEIMAIDTSGGGETPVRLSKPFVIYGSIEGIFEKVGFDYNSRRGWILTWIGDAVLVTPNTSFGGVSFWTQRVPQQVFVGSATRRQLSQIPEFLAGDSITVRWTGSPTDDISSIRFNTSGGMITRAVEPESVTIIRAVYYSGFAIPDIEGYGHFVVESMTEGTITDTLRYSSAAMGPIYRVR